MIQCVVCPKAWFHTFGVAVSIFPGAFHSVNKGLPCLCPFCALCVFLWALVTKKFHLKLICFVSVSSVLFVPPTHLLVMQVVLWGAPDFFSILCVICVSDALVKSAVSSALMMQKRLSLCCILQCFVNFNILPQATKKSANQSGKQRKAISERVRSRRAGFVRCRRAVLICFVSVSSVLFVP